MAGIGKPRAHAVAWFSYHLYQFVWNVMWFYVTVNWFSVKCIISHQVIPNKLICQLWSGPCSFSKIVVREKLQFCIWLTLIGILLIIFGTCWQFSDFNLSGGCFGTDIIQKCTKWSQIGVHGLKIWPIFAKFQCASFLIRKNLEKWQYGRKKHKNVVFREKKSLRSYTGHTKVGKNKFSDIIYSNWINLIIYNEI